MDLTRFKKILREDEMPFFSDEDIEFYINENNGDVKKSLYHLLIVKSENTNISLPGLSTNDTSSYFKRLAARYKSNNSHTL